MLYVLVRLVNTILIKSILADTLFNVILIKFLTANFYCPLKMILCCNCGIDIEPNPRNMCERCLNNATDLTSRIITNMSIETCRGCERYNIPPNSWKSFAWGSKDLLIYLLSRNKSLKKLNIIDSNFIYTEEHSKKMKVEILILEDGVEQSCVLNYNIKNLQCAECMRSEAKQYWKAVVQLRQKPHHKRTFLYLEQLIMNHKAHLDTSNIKDRKDGIDFYYLDRGDALKMVDFLSSFCGTKVINSSRLISEDDSNNTANKKFTFSVEILPFCKDDLVYISNNNLGLGNLVLVTKARNMVTFVDPVSGRTNKISCKYYFGNESQFKILLRSDNFKKYKVVYARPVNNEFTEATITDDGINFYDVTTLLKMKDDDVVLGYNLANTNLSTDIKFDQDILLVRVFNEVERNWRLKTDKPMDNEFKYFIDDIANDKEMLNNMCIYDDKDELIEDFSKINF